VIDDALPAIWPAEVTAAAQKFKQGDLVERPPFFYYRTDAFPVWKARVEGDGGEGLVEIDDRRPHFGLITTQTCALYEDTDRPRQPWLSVAPAYDYTPQLKPGQDKQIKRGRVRHLVHLTSRRLPDGLWVADLRIEVPIEKGWLVGREPLDGFESVRDRLVLAERLASRRQRHALSAPLIKQMTAPLRNWLEDEGRAAEEETDSLRLRVYGDPTTSTVAQLIVVVHDAGLSNEAKSSWGAFEAELIDNGARNAVTVMPFKYGTLDDLTGRDTESSLRLDYDDLSED
jgi:hypothetical protein